MERVEEVCSILLGDAEALPDAVLLQVPTESERANVIGPLPFSPSPAVLSIVVVPLFTRLTWIQFEVS